MRVNILHAFSNQEDMMCYVSSILTLGTFRRKELRIELAGEVFIEYKVINNHEDFMKICGKEYHHVEWHYTPEHEIERYVRTRLRGRPYVQP